MGLLHFTIELDPLLELEADPDCRAFLSQAWLGTVRLAEVNGRWERLATLESLRAVRSLDLSGEGLTDSTLAGLLKFPRLENTTRLSLSNNRISDACLHPLCDSPLLPRLTHLDVRNNQLTDVGSQTLMGWPGARRLRQLEVFGNPVGPRTLALVHEWNRQRGAAGDRTLNSLGMEFVRIPAGTFLMGSPSTEKNRYPDEGPRHQVTLTRPFWLGLYPVTQLQFQQVMGENPSTFTEPPDHWFYPVERASWEQAVEFCWRLGNLPAEKQAGRTYRLPTEAEWEHACRGGTDTPFPHPHYHNLSSHDANFDGAKPYGKAPKGPYLHRTSAVGAYPSTAFGLYDMLGNVWEWCQDDRGSYRRGPQVDPVHETGDEEKICRGASWYSPGFYLRAADRGSDSRSTQERYYGFRVVCLHDAGA